MTLVVPSGVTGPHFPVLISRRYPRERVWPSLPVNTIFDESPVHEQKIDTLRRPPRVKLRVSPGPMGYRTTLPGVEGKNANTHFPSGEIPLGSPSPRRMLSWVSLFTT